ncbi:MAG: PilT/PilU family type 4a pilus ATPase [Helicobacteraceae bacterium]|jgi:twitching motility protein PilT|nr:PilT/PilU family type 4a pilus ATPase [Helicobacteraceae bacterium]
MAVEINVAELTFEVTERVKGYLKTLVNKKGSDLHIKSGQKIMGRIRGDISPISEDLMTRQDALTMAKEMLRGRFGELVSNKEIDFTFQLDEKYRFRVNAFFQKDGLSAVFRTIPTEIKTIEELGLPAALNQLVEKKRGLVLVTGVTGSGKSTTLAAIIDAINRKRKEHIITIEDPIEFVHQDKSCIINQRSIGEDTLSFANALRGALREDPDIVLVGEMRDLETIEIALHAAETGHLVFSTLHTLDSKETINRVIGMFPKEEQNRVRLTLASVLAGVVSQRLVKTLDNKRAAALEILLDTPRVIDLIMNYRDDEVQDALAEGRHIYGTQTFDQHLLEMFNAGKISEDDALSNANSPDDLKIKIRGAIAEKYDAPKDSGVIGIKAAAF